MAFLKVVLTLLFAAPDLLVSADNVINCYGDVQRLSCATGLIRVKTAIYGRTDSTTCSFGRPPSQVQNTQCSMNIPLIYQRCNGQKVCEFKTDAIGSPDPCYGTFKYYTTTYECVPGSMTVICEGGYGTLDCGNQYIQISNANYGRIDGQTCSDGRPSSEISNTNCYAPNTLTPVTSQCNGKKTCSLQASHLIFTDPCVGTYKYLTVSYFCIPNPIVTSVTCEGSTAVLTCGNGVIKIESANYGRTDSNTCSSGRPVSEILKTDCYSRRALDEVNRRCDRKTTCSVDASNSVFSDPCVGTYKYLRIEYYCSAETRS